MAKIDIKNDASPATPPSGYIRIYSKPDKVLYYKDDTGVETAIATVTNEQIQDAVGSILTNTASVVLTYDDAGNQIYATVSASGVNHNALSGYVANEHINHSSVSINAGSGLTGGGDLSANRTISMPAVGTSGIYGSSSQIPVFSTDAQGRVTSVSNTSIAASSINHNSLSNLTTGDVHTQYALLAGRASGQTLYGDTAASGSLMLESTSNATKGKIYFGPSAAFDEVNNWLGINTSSPRAPLHVVGISSAQIRGVSNFHYSTDTQSSKACFGKARGTPAAPTAVIANDVLANYTFFGYGSTDFIQGAAIRGVAQQTFSDTAAGTQLEFQVAANSSTGMQTALTIQQNKVVVATNDLRVGSSVDTTDGNLQYTTTNTEHLARQNSTWRVLGINPTILTATGSTSTTSATYATISTMTTTPAAGTYLVLFVGTYTIGADSNGDFAVFVNGSRDTNATSNVSSNATGIGVSSTDGSTVVLITTATVTGSQVVDIRFRENGAGTLTTTNRRLVLIPLSR